MVILFMEGNHVWERGIVTLDNIWQLTVVKE